MAALRVTSIQNPFGSPRSVWAAAETLRLLEAMGLLADDETIDRLDAKTLGRIVDVARDAGIVPTRVIPLRGRWKTDPEQIGLALESVRDALEESPVPSSEWRSLTKLFGVDRLAELTGVSRISLRRYASAERSTPDDVAGRLHFLAKVVGDLRGAYNDIGVRRWFDRPRTALDGRPPSAILKGRWSPDAPDAHAVRQLARSLTASAAT